MFSFSLIPLSSPWCVCVFLSVGAGFVVWHSAVNQTCSCTPSRTRRWKLTSVRTAPNPSLTPATWPSTSASTAVPSPTPAPTARRLSDSSVTYSNTHGIQHRTSRVCVCLCVGVCGKAGGWWRVCVMDLSSNFLVTWYTLISYCIKHVNKIFRCFTSLLSSIV